MTKTTKTVKKTAKIERLYLALKDRPLTSAQIRAQFKIEKPTAEICRLRKRCIVDGFNIISEPVTKVRSGRRVTYNRYRLICLYQD
jgi:hypothetical protein